MANEKNLKQNSQRTPSELREMTSKGGKASGEARRKKRDSRQVLEMLSKLLAKGALAQLLEDAGVPKNARTLQTLRMMGLQKKAELGDVAANRLILEILDELNAPFVPGKDYGFIFRIWISVMTTFPIPKPFKPLLDTNVRKIVDESRRSTWKSTTNEMVALGLTLQSKYNNVLYMQAEQRALRDIFNSTLSTIQGLRIEQFFEYKTMTSI